MLDWIRENGGIDLGNAIMGLGTVAVAFVSLYVAMSAHKHARRRVMLDYRGLWIEEIRKTVAEYLGVIEGLSRDPGADETAKALRRARELDVYLRLKFDLSDPTAPVLFGLLDAIRDKIRSKAIPDEEEINHLLTELRRLLEDRWKSAAR